MNVDFQDQLAVVVEKNCRDAPGDMHTERVAVSDRQLETDLYLGIIYADGFISFWAKSQLFVLLNSEQI